MCCPQWSGMHRHLLSRIAQRIRGQVTSICAASPWAAPLFWRSEPMSAMGWGQPWPLLNPRGQAHVRRGECPQRAGGVSRLWGLRVRLRPIRGRSLAMDLGPWLSCLSSSSANLRRGGLILRISPTRQVPATSDPHDEPSIGHLSFDSPGGPIATGDLRCAPAGARHQLRLADCSRPPLLPQPRQQHLIGARFANKARCLSVRTASARARPRRNHALTRRANRALFPMSASQCAIPGR
ncbi:hypothetical protein J2W27_004465 [Variovorax boronicumulans]|nr:hypothetical protein [Variovorax boronicumulans]